MQTIRLLLAFFLWGGAATWAGAANTTEIRLVLSAKEARPGETFLAGVQLRMAPKWHTYWRNPGEAGKSTEIAWQLPAGITAGNIQWPVPEKYDWSGLFNYVYHRETTLLVPITVGPEVPPGPYELKGTVEWLECEEQCVPGKASVTAAFKIGTNSVASSYAGSIAEAKGRIPKPFPNDTAKAAWEKEPDGQKRPFVIVWKPTTSATLFDFYPYESDSFLVQPATQARKTDGGQAEVKKVLEKFDGGWPSQLQGLLVELGADRTVLGAYEASLPLSPAGEAKLPAVRSHTSETVANTPKEGGSGAPVPDRPLSTEAPTPSFGSLLGKLGLAFLGGLILNIMPCVLPVIALKILGFVNQSKEAPARVRQLGLVYALGVLFSFLVMAGVVVGVQRAGKVASWGMQFGNPQFLVAIIVLVTLVSLNLFGLFEVHLGGRTIGAAGTLAAREGFSGAFFNGILATALATPCTAPFLSVALGFAFTQPPSTIVITFITVGLGLAAPYVVLSLKPSWLKFLPKPGPWMVRFKAAMGFPMLATAIWLFSILTRHYGKDGILWVGLFLVMVSLAAWVWGEFVQRGNRHKGLAVAVSLCLIFGGYLFALEKELHWRTRTAPAEAASLQTDPEGIPWKPWSQAAVEEARANGHPVFVDFTADWCLTCKANKSSSIEINSVRNKLREIGAVTLLADNTLVRDDIAEELRKYGRAGVPLVLVYPANKTESPLVLPTVLTPSIVLNALDRAVN
jgi:thiol:disulfide interchange protein/DsbC/DsbD-like thiol-disulfide interchange protein